MSIVIERPHTHTLWIHTITVMADITTPFFVSMTSKNLFNFIRRLANISNLVAFDLLMLLLLLLILLLLIPVIVLAVVIFAESVLLLSWRFASIFAD